jgi:hypothetical protein
LLRLLNYVTPFTAWDDNIKGAPKHPPEKEHYQKWELEANILFYDYLQSTKKIIILSSFRFTLAM